MPSAEAMNNLSTLTYPRTGKRGVPQQFPRRLYEMLESEAKLAVASPNETFVISWSESGTAFRILDVEVFATTVLPRYFRTKKFSSFQRNLNLYGFTKLRRGPDADMYAHPSFCRGKPESLSELKKSTTASRRRLSKASSDDSSDDSISIPTESRPTARSVSPSPPPRNQTSARFQPTMQIGAPPYLGRNWLTFNERSLEQGNSIQSTPYIPIRKREVVGRLDLLALAIEHEACLAV